jgi:hypothetical protein
MAASGRKRTTNARPITLDELWAALLRALEDLDEAVTRVDSGDLRAFDTIAQRLRVVAGTGSGANLLARTAKASQLTLAPLTVTETPDQDSRGEPLTFAIINLPADTTSCPYPLRQIPLSTLMQRIVISVDPYFASADRATAPPAVSSLTWQELVSTVANKLGPMHVDDNVPTWLDDLVRYKAIGMNPSAYALRALAVAVLRCGADLARAAFRQLEVRPHSYVVAGQWLGRMRVWGRLGGMVYMDVLAGSSAETNQPFSWSADAPRVWP